MEQYASEIRLFGFDFAPKGWAKCEGQLLPVSSNPALYALLGNRFGGDGKTNFALPDLRGRVVIGSGAGYPAFLYAGEQAHRLTIKEMPAHNHGAMASSEDANDTALANNFWAANTGYAKSNNRIMSDKALAPTGDNLQHENMSPYLSLNYCICLDGMHPTESFNDDEEFTGAIKALSIPLVPKNWLFCDGRKLKVSAYFNLFSVIGYIYGGEGDTFCLPDLRGKAAVSYGTTNELTSYELGENAGEKEVILTKAQLPRHRHNTNAGLSGNDAKPANNVWANGPTRPAIVSYAKNKGKGALMNINAIGKTGGDLPHNNMMPFLALNYYINAGGYASQNKY
jgi:microcystin-dependent protein